MFPLLFFLILLVIQVDIFSHIPSRSLNLEGPLGKSALETIKKAALLLRDGRENDDVNHVDLSFHQVELTYVDADNDKVKMLTDCDVIAAVKDYTKIGKVKIMAVISDKKIEDDRSNNCNNHTDDVDIALNDVVEERVDEDSKCF